MIGDPAWEDGLCVVLTPDGLEQHRRGEAAPQLVVQWSQFVELKVRAAYVRWHATPAGGFVGAFAPGADMLKALFDQLTEAKALDRLGDPEWLGAAVAKLSSYTSWYAPKGNRLVEATIRNLGT